MATGRLKGRTRPTWEQYGMIGDSPSLIEVYRAIDRAALSSARVLLVGESGTGKERVARAIHRLGASSKGPFIAVNCAAVPESLVESELFGHEKGAFTGAQAPRRGYFQQAHGGTLFLDEIGDMSLMTQAKVLRAVEHGTITRVGGEQTLPVEFRLISATHTDLRSEIREGNFRDDLFYRLNVVTIELPPLRRHKQDIPALASHFLAVTVQSGGGPPRELSPAAIAELVAHEWPGNVRELRNVVERLSVFADAQVIGAAEVRTALHRASSRDGSQESGGLKEARDEFERAFIMASLSKHDWRIQVTAEALGINRTYLWKKMRRLGITQPE